MKNIPCNVDSQDDDHHTPPVPIQLAAAAAVVGPCSSLHLSQGAAAANAGSTSPAQIHVPQKELQLPVFDAGTP